MTTIELMRHARYAPCGFIVARAPFDLFDDANTVLVQTDWEFPALASEFGFQRAQGPGGCKHDATDGTINCSDCGRTASEFICEAQEWLHDNVGARAEDSGYFT